jgi:CubicO group peptidase (beta-lactamase class C family)
MLKQLPFLVPLTLAIMLSGQSAPAPERDPLLEYRRANLPKTVPWPTSFFQPQIPVEGRPSRDLRVVAPAMRTISPAALEAATAYAQSQQSTALLVYRNGRLEHAWYPPNAGPDTISHTYTMHYTPVTLLVGMAIADRKITSLDEPAATYLPEWRGDDRSKITIRNLLQQNAGLDLRFDAHYSKGLYSRDARAYWGSRTKEVLVNEYPAKFEPGTRFDYNYIVPEILSIILARTTGMPYERYLSEKLWKPLGNKRAFLWLNRPGGDAHVDAGLFSAPTDWLNLGILLLNEGRWNGRQLVPKSFVAEMRRPSKPNPNFGFMYLGSPFAAVRTMATDPKVTYVVKSAEPFRVDDISYIDGYGGQRAYISPSLRLVVVRIGAVAREWDNSKLMNLIIDGIDRTRSRK